MGRNGFHQHPELAPVVPTEAVPGNRDIDLPDRTVSFDPEAFDLAVRSQGVKMIHYKSMPCPIGVTDVFSDRAPHSEHSNCSNGFIYKEGGLITILFIGNSTQYKNIDAGLMDGSSVVVTFPRSYDESEEPIFVMPYDRFYLADEQVEIAHWQLVEAHATGRDRLSFPACQVLEIMDNTGKTYKDGDYNVVGGQIHWTGSNQPGQDIETSRGRIYSIRYTYRPYWYVSRMLKEVRVAQVEHFATERHVERMPQSAIFAREYVYNKDNNSPQTSNPRQVFAPRDGGFGPR